MKTKKYKQNEHTCDELMQELLDACQELDHLCRANVALSKKNFEVDQEKKKSACSNIVDILNKIKSV